MGKLDPKSSLPPYLQVASEVVGAIRNDTYKPGDRLPSYQALATEYGVAIGTVKSALALLRERGVVVTRHGYGSTVHPDLDPTTLDANVELARDPGMAEVLALLGEIRDRLESIEARLPPA